MGSWSQSRTITRQTWGVVKANPYMLAFPALAAVVAALVVVVVAGIGLGLLGLTGAAEQLAEDGTVEDNSAVVIGIVVLVVAAYLGTLVTQICMAGLVKCADEELQGRDSSFGEGLSAALGHLPALLGWAAIQTIVGWLLSAIRGNGSSGNAAIQIARVGLAGLAQVAWSVVSFFVLPLIILRGMGPIEAVKRSFAMIRSTWGMQIAGGVRLGFLVAILGILPGIAAIVGGVFLMIGDKAVAGVPLAAIGVIVVVVAQVLISALRAVFAVALFHYADGGQAVGPYSAAELQHSVRLRG
jgi:hypothetical protein